MGSSSGSSVGSSSGSSVGSSSGSSVASGSSPSVNFCQRSSAVRHSASAAATASAPEPLSWACFNASVAWSLAFSARINFRAISASASAASARRLKRSRAWRVSSSISTMVPNHCRFRGLSHPHQEAGRYNSGLTSSPKAANWSRYSSKVRLRNLRWKTLAPTCRSARNDSAIRSAEPVSHAGGRSSGGSPI